MATLPHARQTLSSKRAGALASLSSGLAPMWRLGSPESRGMRAATYDDLRETPDSSLAASCKTSSVQQTERP